MTTSKLIVFATTIAIVFFIIGYSTYPYLHSDIDTVGVEASWKEQQFETDKISTRKEVNVKPLQLDSPIIEKVESLVAVDVDTDESFNDQTTSNVAVRGIDAEEKIDSDNKSSEFVEEKLNFDQWKQNNKIETLEKMQHMLPESIHDVFTKMVKEDDYFSDLAANQNAISDEEESQIMETKIRDFVALHELGSHIQLIDLDCVQLSCRIFSVSSSPHAWMNVSIELFFSFIKQGYLPNEANIKKGVSYRGDDGNTYSYDQMAFLKGKAQ